MKTNLYPIIALIFIALSIYLSILIKNKNQQLAERERTINAQNQEMDDYRYLTALLQESVLLNITGSPCRTIDNEIHSRYSESDMMVLYLKAHACSPCNMPVLKRIIPTAAQNDNFIILSHDSNKHFLSQLQEKANTIKVDWFNEPLYSGQSNQIDGELLLIDHLGFVKGIIPVEYLKDEMFFEMPNEYFFTGLQ